MQVQPPITEDNPRISAWHAVYTRHQHEKTVAQSLERKQFEVFLPLYSVTRRWKDRTKGISVPLFPCYVFLRGYLKHSYDVLSTPGVNCVLSTGGQPASIPEAEIDAIRRVVATTLLTEPYPFLRCGDKVRVKSGPLAGIEGILIRKKTSLRLVLSVSLLERSVAVEVDGLDVERVTVPHRAVQPLPAVAWSTS